MDANTWQANRSGTALPARQQNQFGGSVGGPVRKDRTFFFFTYEGKRINTIGFGQWTVPTALERAGDFSQTLNAQGQMRVIYDPFSTRPDPNNAGKNVRDPMPGNVIPQSRTDPVALKMLKYWPEPNQAGQRYTNALNLAVRASFLSPTDRYEFKVDHNFTANQRVFVRYDRLTTKSADYDYWKNGATPQIGIMEWGSHNAAIDYTNTLSSRTVLNGRLGLNRFEALRPSFSYGFNVSEAFGWPSSLDQVIRAMNVPMFPDVVVQDVASLGQVQGPYYTSANTQYMGVANVAHVTGRHNTKAGFEMRAFYLGFVQYGPPSFNFSRTMSQGPDPRTPSELAGYGFASFLFGAGDSGSVSHGPRTYNYSKYYALYVQDDFKLSRKLTVNLGLRWEIEGGNVERFNRIRNAYCRACDRSLSSYDQPKRLVVNFTYELPFGKGKQFGGGWNPATNLLLGGWQANGILTLSAGMPIVISQSSNTSYSFGGNQHPDSTGVNADLGDSRSVYQWFDTRQFLVAQPYTFGNLDRTTNIRQDWTRGIDFSLFKTANVFRERVKLQFRAEAFNLTNTPIFSSPNGNVQSATFGQVTSQNNSPRQVQLALKLLF